MRGYQRLLLIALLSLAAIPQGFASGGVDLPGGYRSILGSDAGPEMMKQCSRSTPSVTDFWQPSVSDIKTFEKLLPDYLAKLPGTKPPDGSYGRQYIGIQIGSKLLIYGNFYPRRPGINPNQAAPVVVCDGGAAFFGIVFDPQTENFSELQMNGNS